MSNNDLNPILEMALAMYADEPCRICGRLLTMDDIKAGAVFAGYSDDNKSRAAHETCWNNANAIFGQKAGSHE